MKTFRLKQPFPVLLLLLFAFTSISVNSTATVNGGEIGYQGIGRGCSGSKIQFINVAPATGGSGAFVYSWQDSVPGVSGWRTVSSDNSVTYAGTVLYDKYHYFRRKAADESNTTDFDYSNVLNISMHFGYAGFIKFLDGSYSITVAPGKQPPFMVNVDDGFVEFLPMYYAWEKKRKFNGFWSDISNSFNQKNLQVNGETVEDFFTTGVMC